MRSSNFKLVLNSFSSPSGNSRTTSGKEGSGTSTFVIVAIVLSGNVVLCLVYLLLLLSVVSWTHIFQRSNIHNYVEVVEQIQKHTNKTLNLSVPNDSKNI